VSFHLKEGETLGLVGESGCGKTTLGRTLLRLAPATSGEVRYQGENLLELPSSDMRGKRRELQMIFQDLDAALNPKMTVLELLREAITLHESLPSEDVLRRSEELLSLV
jgi:ABC-type glutathione transport system ATPase component